MTWLFVPMVLLALIAAGYLALRAKNKKLSETLKAQWGQKPSMRMLDEDVLADISGYYRAKSKHHFPKAPVDDLTWQDVDMDRVISQMNLCQSVLGSEVMYDLLRDTGADQTVLNRRRKLIDLFRQNADLRVPVQLALRKAGQAHFHGAVRHLYESKQLAPQHPWLYYILSQIPLVVYLLAVFLYRPLLLGVIAAFALNAFVYYKTSIQFTGYMTAARHLGRVLVAANQLKKVRYPGLQEEIQQIEKHSRLFKRMKFWQPVFMAEGLSSMAVDMSFVIEFAKIFLLHDLVAICRVSGELNRYTDEMKALYQQVGELDALMATAAFTDNKDWCAPAFHEELSVSTGALCHPLLEHPVANDFVWQKNTLITGSNASGKSTFIKALAVNAILAQTLMVCRADSLAMCRSRIMTAMAVKDSIARGESYYIAEIKALKRIMDAVRDDGLPVLCLVDEILRGTNTVERLAASCAVLESFAHKNLLCINATHDGELVGLLGDSYDNYHFRDDLGDAGMVFTYRLHPGPAGGRNAIKLLSHLGFEEAVIRRAQSLAADFDRKAERFQPGEAGQ